MSIADKLSGSKNALVYLLDFANAKSGKTDANIGDAIKTLCDGYGKGGGIEFLESYYTPSEDETVEYAINKMGISVSDTKNTLVIIGAKNLFSDMDADKMEIKQSVCACAVIMKYTNSNAFFALKSASNNYHLNASYGDMRNKFTVSNGYLASTVDNIGASTTYAYSYFPAGITLKILKLEL